MFWFTVLILETFSGNALFYISFNLILNSWKFSGIQRLILHIRTQWAKKEKYFLLKFLVAFWRNTEPFFPLTEKKISPTDTHSSNHANICPRAQYCMRSENVKTMAAVLCSRRNTATVDLQAMAANISTEDDINSFCCGW